MGTALANGKGNNLYKFWGSQIAEYLNERLSTEREPIIVNLASQESVQVRCKPCNATNIFRLLHTMNLE
jgi:cytoplasmic iron level regulating protein YaaA (DUF328/UPF0246 family)